MIIPRYYAESDTRIAIHHLTPHAPREVPVVVMCHPTGFCGLAYSAVSAHMRNVNIFAIDMRSHGYSERGDVTQWSGFARDLEAAFVKIVELTGHITFFGVGISSGSSAHILNAQKNPGLYAGLYLCEPILFGPDSDLSGREQLAHSAAKRREIFESRDIAYNRFSQTAFSALSSSALALYCTHGFEDTSEGITLRCRREDEHAIYLSGTANGVYDALEDLEAPCVVAYGETSTTVTQESAQMIAGKIPRARVEKIDGSGHFTLFEQPVLGADKVTAFIDFVTTGLS